MIRALALLAVAVPLTTFAQRKLHTLPDISGYKTLKGDFHIHTVFSDGEVWPTFRIDEAAREGLDVIAITDHIEYLPHKKYITASHNDPFEVAYGYARERNILLIKGVEVTRAMPTGHFNVLFLQDADKLVDEDFMKVMEEANRQGAFVFWNHPGWKSQQPDGVPKFHPVHQELLKRGWLHGIEFYNTKCAYGFVLDWCEEKNLTVFSNSDVHIAASDFWEYNKGGSRPVTLVFAKERTESAVKEALKTGRTLALFSGDSLGGKPQWAEAFFKASIQVNKAHFEDKDYRYVEVVNLTSLPYYLVNADPKQDLKSLTLAPGTATKVKLKKDGQAEQRFIVKNIMVGDGKFLETSLKLIVD
ncbi:MAG TPA: Sb-PDE family phosphodiesterase [Chryseosolibacter sp.]|nr:Sb-PDE family phosphodiesterase [Chryseosolibacter sp.]